MGYITRYDLIVRNQGEHELEEIEHEMRKYDEIDLGMTYDMVFENPFKWYEHEKHMREISEKFPDVLFQLHGEGEEQGDEWYKYFKNGKMQQCYAKITFDPYDESRMF